MFGRHGHELFTVDHVDEVVHDVLVGPAHQLQPPVLLRERVHSDTVGRVQVRLHELGARVRNCLYLQYGRRVEQRLHIVHSDFDLGCVGEVDETDERVVVDVVDGDLVLAALAHLRREHGAEVAADAREHDAVAAHRLLAALKQ